MVSIRGITYTKLHDMREAVGVGRVIRVAYKIAGVQLGLILEYGRLQLAQFLELFRFISDLLRVLSKWTYDEIALLATLELDTVDGRSWFDGRMICLAERTVEKGIQESALSSN